MYSISIYFPSTMGQELCYVLEVTNDEYHTVTILGDLEV